MSTFSTLSVTALRLKKWLGLLATGLLITQSAQAQSGNALNFDGLDDYVNVPASLTTGVTNFTFEAWLNYQDSGNWARVFDFGTGTGVNMFLTPRNSYTGTPRFAITTNGAANEQQLTSNVALSTGQHHLAVTLSQNAGVVTGTLYLDGAVVATNANMTLTPSSLGPLSNLWLGRSQYGNDPYLKGDLDEVRFYTTALTQSQIQADMKTTSSAAPSKLLAYYDFNEGIANGNNAGVTTLLDRSGHGNAGTLNNFALSGSTSNWVGSTAPLPVTLVSFTAQYRQGSGSLTWITASELNSAYFELQSSVDGMIFSAIGRVAAQGSTAQEHTYQFTDTNLGRYHAALVYYRLRQVDADGTSTYSPVQSLPLVASALAFNAFPTCLAGDQVLTLQVSTSTPGAVDLLVVDALGRSVVQQQLALQVNSSTLTLPQARQWAPGLYVVRVQQGNQHQTVRIAHE